MGMMIEIRGGVLPGAGREEAIGWGDPVYHILVGLLLGLRRGPLRGARGASLPRCRMLASRAPPAALGSRTRREARCALHGPAGPSRVALMRALRLCFVSLVS